jgi:glycosyltransferase involved in cell wall biosynthesis
MPNHNCGAYIAAAIDSVIAQTYTNWELIIIDDASSDNSLAVINQYTEQNEYTSKIRLIKITESKGLPSIPRNAGLDAAQGQYIAFIDSDDMWLPEKLEMQVAFLEQSNVQENRTGLVYSDYEKIDEDGTRTGRIIQCPQEVTYKSLLKSNPIKTSTLLIESGLTEGIRFKDIHHEDLVYFLELLQKQCTNAALSAKVVNIGRVLTLYRVRNSSVSANKLTAFTWQWHIYRKVLHLSFVRSVYYLCNYSLNGLLKYIK